MSIVLCGEHDRCHVFKTLSGAGISLQEFFNVRGECYRRAHVLKYIPGFRFVPEDSRTERSDTYLNS